METIRRIEVIPLVRKLRQPFEGSTYKVISRNTIYARLETSGGIIGEAFGGDEDVYQEKVVEIANEYLAPLLIGKELAQIENLWEQMFQVKDLPLHNRSIHTLDMVNHAVLMQAIAAIDMVLWDAFGKVLGQPLYKVWGEVRNSVPVIAIGGYYQPGVDISELREEINLVRQLELAGIKLKVGRWSVEEDIRRVTYIRENFPPDLVLCCDANQAWTFGQALQFARAVKDLNIEWLEEPLRWYDQLYGLNRLREVTGMRIVSGQGEISKWGCRDLILNGCIDALNVDATIAGGITEWRRIANFAELMHVNMGHHEEPQVALQLLAATRNATYVEIFPNRERDPMWYELVEERPRISGGLMFLPKKPGLGLSYNHEVINKYNGFGEGSANPTSL